MIEPGAIRSMLGVAGGLGLTASAPLFAMLPPWFPEIEKWGGVAAIFVGIFATTMIGLGQCLKNVKAWHDIREQARKEMQEIKAKNEEAVCLNRRLTGICPLCLKKADEKNR